MIASAEFIPQQVDSLTSQNQFDYNQQPQDQFGQSNSNQVLDFQNLVNGSQSASAIGSTSGVQVQTLGDAILRGMRSMADRIDTGFQDISNTSNNNPTENLDSSGDELDLGSISQVQTPADMLRLQVQAIRFGFELQLSGQIVNKSTSDIEMFLKAQ